MTRTLALVAPGLLVALVLAGCGERHTGAMGQVNLTKAPGHVTAGGRTSGEIMAAAPESRKQEGTSGPAGTPGTPKGMEGNTGGAGVVAGPSGATVQSAPPPAPELPIRSEKAGTAPASEDVKTGEKVRPTGVNADAPAAVMP